MRWKEGVVQGEMEGGGGENEMEGGWWRMRQREGWWRVRWREGGGRGKVNLRDRTGRTEEGCKESAVTSQ